MTGTSSLGLPALALAAPSLPAERSCWTRAGQPPASKEGIGNPRLAVFCPLAPWTCPSSVAGR
eukprot:1252435-Lingulodinium_polyedra.AAC.1